jgi:ribonuclease HI
MKLKLFTDGGSRGNPGHAAYGFVVYDVTSGAGIVLEKCGNYIGETTNNQAEYEGLIAGLKCILEQQPNSEIEICMDSLLVVNQVKGLFKMKNAALAPKLTEVRGLLKNFSKYSINYVPRAQNSVADSLVNAALDNHLGSV